MLQVFSLNFDGIGSITKDVVVDVFWVPSSHGSLPEHAVEAGYEADSPLFVARAYVNGILLPGKFNSCSRKCHVSWRGVEYIVADYEILTDSQKKLRWHPSARGMLINKAIIGGRTESGECMFIGRAWHEGALNTGRIHPSNQVCLIAMEGKEVSYVTYEILVL